MRISSLKHGWKLYLSFLILYRVYFFAFVFVSLFLRNGRLIIWYTLYMRYVIDAEVQYYMFREVVTDVTLLYITLGSTDVIWSVSLRLVVHVAPSRKQEFPIGVITPTPSIVAIQKYTLFLLKAILFWMRYKHNYCLCAVL